MGLKVRSRFDVAKLKTSFPGHISGDKPLKSTSVTQVLERAHAVWADESDFDALLEA